MNDNDNDRAARAELAPHGHLRTAINYGNPVLAQQDPHTGQPRGVSADLALALAQRLGVAVHWVPFDGAGKVAAAASNDVWDIAFLAIDPLRAEGIAFTPPYVVIEGSYLVNSTHPARHVDELDRPGVRIAVGQGAAYDLYLARTLKHAQLVRADTSQAAMALFVAQGLDAVAGVRQPLQRFAAGRQGLRVIDGRFTTIQQAIGTPLKRPAGLAMLTQFIEAMKASGFVAAALQRSGQHDAAVAPPAAA